MEIDARGVTWTAPDRLPVLGRGSHRNEEEGACAMEAASWIAGEAWSDHPKAVHPLIAGVARATNDQLSDDERQSLWPLILASIGTGRSSSWRLSRRPSRIVRRIEAQAGGRESLNENGDALRALWAALIDECDRFLGSVPQPLGFPTRPLPVSVGMSRERA